MDAYLERIKKLKSQKKMTNSMLSERTGIPLGTLSKVLAGMSDALKLPLVVSLAEALDTTVEYIATGVSPDGKSYVLNEQEESLITGYRRLDPFARSMVDTVLAKELERGGDAAETAEESAAATDTESAEEPIETGRKARILENPWLFRSAPANPAESEMHRIRFFDTPVSAGVGEHLEGQDMKYISVPAEDDPNGADFALRVNGDSMEPRFQNGDVVLVQEVESIQRGQIGVFVLDGAGYIKVYNDTMLLSINPAYAPILLSQYSDVQLKGRVVGRLKQK